WQAADLQRDPPSRLKSWGCDRLHSANMRPKECLVLGRPGRVLLERSWTLAFVSSGTRPPNQRLTATRPFSPQRIQHASVSLSEPIRRYPTESETSFETSSSCAASLRTSSALPINRVSMARMSKSRSIAGTHDDAGGSSSVTEIGATKR